MLNHNAKILGLMEKLDNSLSKLEQSVNDLHLCAKQAEALCNAIKTDFETHKKVCGE